MTTRRKPPVPSPTIDDTPELEVFPLPDETGDPATVGAAWSWLIVTATTRGVLRFGDRCDTEDAARTAAEEALAELSVDDR